MKASIDSQGRVVVPKALRDALGLTPGTTVDVSLYGAGLLVIPAGRVVEGETVIDDQDVFDLIDAGRR